MKDILRKLYSGTGLDGVALFIVIMVIISTNLSYKFWTENRRIITDDVILYYEYLPSLFIYHDITMAYTDKDVPKFRGKIWKIRTEPDKYVSKMTMGLAVLYAPFFLVAHAVAGPAGYPADGYSTPYRVALIISSILSTFFGLFFLLKLLRKYFARNVIALTILAIGLGTNLYFYSTVEPTMSHSYNFFLFALFIYLVDKWLEDPSWLITILAGLIGGLIILVRPTNGLILILLPLWKVDSVSTFKARILLFFNEFLKTAAIILLLGLVFFPQLLYWKFNTGHYFFYTYGQERFFFNNPVFLKGLFSFRKGWLIYTPMMAFSLLGIIVLYFRQRKFFWPVFVFTFLNLYIIFSWWCWWYGGSFGQRALIESYALLALPFAALADFIVKSRIILRVAFFVLFILFFSLNIFQNWQYKEGLIHWDSMTRKTYEEIFLKTRISGDYYDRLEKPDYQAALKGER